MNCYCADYAPDFRHERHVTVREATDQERTIGWGHHPLTPVEERSAGNVRRARKYVVVDYADPTTVFFVFSLPETADTREEIVFWAERLASKNGYGFIRPEGWEDVIGDLPVEEIAVEEVSSFPVQPAKGEKVHAFSGWSTPDGKPPVPGF